MLPWSADETFVCEGVAGIARSGPRYLNGKGVKKEESREGERREGTTKWRLAVVLGPKWV